MNLSVNGYDILELKNKLNIETTLALSYTTYKSGDTKKVIERGYITQDAVGDIKKEIITLITGSIGTTTIIRLIYTEWPEKNPTIRTYRYEHTKNQNTGSNL